MSKLPTLKDAQVALERHFGFSRFREGQEGVIASVLEGKNVIVVMPTGGGKSLCYQLPAMMLEGTALVVSPLIALMKDQVDGLNAREIPATYINSSLSYEDQRDRLWAMEQGRYRLVYIAPERFRNQRFLDSLKQLRISLFAIDEAHCISQWGHDFRPDYLRLKEAIENLGRPQIIALTATATQRVQTDISKQLGLEGPTSFVAGFDRHNLYLRVEPIKTDRDRMAKAYQIAKKSRGVGIIYCATRKAVEEVAGGLRLMGLRAGEYHGGLDDTKRARVQDHFMAGDLDAIVATNAFGMGVDKPDIRFVTHYQCPGSIEAYYQEVGRAGRDGLPSLCTLLFNYVDVRIHEFFIAGSFPARAEIERVYSCLLGIGADIIQLSAREIASRTGLKNEMGVNSALVYLEKAGHLERSSERGQGVRMLDRAPVTELRVAWKEIMDREAAEQRKLREMLNLAYSDKCLRQFILRYFGDRKPVANCRCSACVPKIVWGEIAKIEKKTTSSRTEDSSAPEGRIEEAADQAAPGPRPLSDQEHLAVRKMLSCVARMDGRFGKGAVASVLRGSRAKNIIQNELDQLSTYGMLGQYSQDDLTLYLNALIVAGCIDQSRGAYPVLHLTALGRDVMQDRARVDLDLEAVEADISDETPPPPPVQSGTREMTYELYQQGLTIEAIAAQRNLKLVTISEHLATLIEEGREINLDRFVSPAERSLIEAAAKVSGFDALRPIKDQLPDQISYNEIRLVVAGLRYRNKTTTTDQI
jgi:ATP-dependent DNA helicase RecQ